MYLVIIEFIKSFEISGFFSSNFFPVGDSFLVFYSPLLTTKVIEKKLIHEFSQRLIFNAVNNGK